MIRSLSWLHGFRLDQASPELRGSTIFRRGAPLALLLFLAGCFSVQFVSDYDEVIDRGITDFQRQIEKHFAMVERAIGTAPVSFAHHARFYDDAAIDLIVLRARASMSPHNDLTVAQIDLLLSSLQTLQALHREGLTANDLPPLRAAFATSCTAIIKFELAKKRERKPSD